MDLDGTSLGLETDGAMLISLMLADSTTHVTTHAVKKKTIVIIVSGVLCIIPVSEHTLVLGTPFRKGCVRKQPTRITVPLTGWVVMPIETPNATTTVPSEIIYFCIPLYPTGE